jgi:hypothetical protein
MQTYAPPKLDPTARAAMERGEFDFLIPVKKPLLRKGEVADVLQRSLGFVTALVDSGRLEAHRDSAAGGPEAERQSDRITRRSLLLYLVSTSNYEPSYSVIGVELICKTYGPAQLDRLIAFCSRQKNLIA